MSSPAARRRSRRPARVARRAPAPLARSRRWRSVALLAVLALRASTTRSASSRCRCATRTIIRQQAADKRLDPALIAASSTPSRKFDAQTSSAGAEGLMQILPADRRLHRAPVRRHALHRERPGDAAGQRRLRQLVPALPARPLRRQRDARARRLQRRPGERRPLGRARATRTGETLTVAAIPFPETRAYVAARARARSRTTATPTRASSA